MKKYLSYFIFIIIVSPIISQDSDVSVKNLKVGDIAPDWSLRTEFNKYEFLKNWTVKKNRQLRKPSVQPDRHVVIFVFFATWCPPCVDQLLPLEKVYQKYKDRKVKFFIIDETDPNSDSPDTRTMFSEKNINIPFLRDNWTLGRKYGIRAIPTIFTVDKYGVIQNIRVAYNDEEDFVGELSKIIDSIL